MEAIWSLLSVSGLIYTIPLIDKWKKIDMRMRAFSVPPQEVCFNDVCKSLAAYQFQIIISQSMQ